MHTDESLSDGFILCTSDINNGIKFSDIIHSFHKSVACYSKNRITQKPMWYISTAHKHIISGVNCETSYSYFSCMKCKNLHKKIVIFFCGEGNVQADC